MLFYKIPTIFHEAGIEVTPANRKQIDRAVHRLIGADINEHCPTVWKMLKQQVLADDDKGKEFISRLKAAVNEVNIDP